MKQLVNAVSRNLYKYHRIQIIGLIFIHTLILQAKRSELTPAVKKVVQRKAEGFGKVLWEIRLDAIERKIKDFKKSENAPHTNIIEGLSQTIPALDTFLDTSSQDSENDEFCIKVYDAVHLENGQILRTAEEFHGKEWFSNVAITPAEDQVEQYNLDDGAWYGKVSKLKGYQRIGIFHQLTKFL